MAGASYDRSALIFDPHEQALAKTSLSLIALGHRPFYATDFDELVLLARERRAQLGAVLIPAAHVSRWWSALRARVLAPLALEACSVLPVGQALAPADSASLHSAGIRWALAEPFSLKELRFAVSMVLSATDPNELRIETRVPCSIAIEVGYEGRAVRARISDLSAGGAFVEIDRPLTRGEPVVVRGTLCGRLVSLPARVSWRTGLSSPKWRATGMGIEFGRIGLDTLAVVRREVERALARFQFDAAACADQLDGVVAAGSSADAST
jgi:Tfp pilus assembly protein PilZ